MDEIIDQTPPIIEPIPEVVPKKKLPIWVWIIVLIFIILKQQQLLNAKKQEVSNNIVPTAEPTQVPAIIPTNIPTENDKFTFNDLSFELPPGYTVSTWKFGDRNGTLIFVDIIKKDKNNTFKKTLIGLKTNYQSLAGEGTNPVVTIEDAEMTFKETDKWEVLSKTKVKIGNNIDALKTEFVGMIRNSFSYDFIKYPNILYHFYDDSFGDDQIVVDMILKTLKIN